MKMTFVSTRKEMGNEDEIGPTTFWEFDIEDQVEDVSSRTQITFHDVVNQISGKSVLILVHGYNNELEDIVRAYDLIRSRVFRLLGDWYDDVLGFTWPGGDSPIDWYAPKRRAGVIGPRLARFLLEAKQIAQNVDLMSHSLGARVALTALNSTPPNTVRANFLTASAVDNESIEIHQRYFPGVQVSATESVVFHSKHDSVLKSAYRIAEWDNPLGLFGPENPASLIEHLPNTYVANCKHVIEGHGEYKLTDEIFTFIDDWLNGNVNAQFVTL